MKYTVLIPAAGSGSRFGSVVPKQYVSVCGKPVLQHTLDLFAADERIGRIAVVISPQDEWFDGCIRLPAHALVFRKGGDSRAETVANGLAALADREPHLAEGWVLVHDAARCCLPRETLNRLFTAIGQGADGAVLAVKVTDTVKHQDGRQRISHTVPRDALWQAQTPQAFPFALLRHALSAVPLAEITDEASAAERLGVRPLLVEGDSRNIKLTHSSDLSLAEWLLQTQSGG